ncbi:MAG: hypothetical protein ACHRXM_28045, partial [Isosphaerales bacterium]
RLGDKNAPGAFVVLGDHVGMIGTVLVAAVIRPGLVPRLQPASAPLSRRSLAGGRNSGIINGRCAE